MACHEGCNDIEIYRAFDGIADNVVRWCDQCGSIVVDAEADGRTYKGKIRRRTSPSVADNM